MIPRLAIGLVLVVCGTMCILATIALSAYMIKQLAPMIGTDNRIHESHMLLVGVAGIPGTLTFAVGVTLLVIGLRSALAKTES